MSHAVLSWAGNSESLLSDQRIRELLEAAPDAILQVDESGRIILLNRVAEQMFGYTRDELLGQPVELLIPHDLRARHQAHRQAYRRHPTTRAMGIGMTLEGLRRDGTRFPVEISLSPSDSEEGFRITAIVRDVTERRLNEERLRQVQEAYTRELELRNREVERANRLKSEFLASMSHELRTPLHTIIGFSELLAEQIQGPLNEKQLRFVNHIHRDSLHLLELINDILDLSKIESGRLELRPEPFVFADVLKESLGTVRAPAAAKSIVIETAVDVPQAVEADRLRVKQILVNLLSNAVKFTPDGGRVRVEAAVDGACVRASVIDTGVGIPKEEQQAVFDKFHQVGNTTKGVREGTGLGLAITRSLVEQHGGAIELHSEPGRGTRFTFTLPLRQTKRGSDEKSAGG
jgi:PAS domain S-box-containing protein